MTASRAPGTWTRRLCKYACVGSGLVLTVAWCWSYFFGVFLGNYIQLNPFVSVGANSSSFYIGEHYLVFYSSFVYDSAVLTSAPVDLLPHRMELPWATMYALPHWLPGLVLIGFGLWLRTSRLRPRPGHCACGYCLVGNMSGRCPECGSTLERSITRAPTVRREYHVRAIGCFLFASALSVILVATAGCVWLWPIAPTGLVVSIDRGAMLIAFEGWDWQYMTAHALLKSATREASAGALLLVLPELSMSRCGEFLITVPLWMPAALAALCGVCFTTRERMTT